MMHSMNKMLLAAVLADVAVGEVTWRKACLKQCKDKGHKLKYCLKECPKKSHDSDAQQIADYVAVRDQMAADDATNNAQKVDELQALLTEAVNQELEDNNGGTLVAGTDELGTVSQSSAPSKPPQQAAHSSTGHLMHNVNRANRVGANLDDESAEIETGFFEMFLRACGKLSHKAKLRNRVEVANLDDESAEIDTDSFEIFLRNCIKAMHKAQLQFRNRVEVVNAEDDSSEIDIDFFDSFIRMCKAAMLKRFHAQ